MDASNLDFWFWNIVIIVYFLSKGFIFSRIFKKQDYKIHPVISLIIALIGLYINYKLQADYENYLSMSYVKGAIKLPPFTLLYIIADFVGSSLLLLVMAYSSLTSNKKEGYSNMFVEIVSPVFLFVSFTLISSLLWFKETSRNMNFNYQCFKDQILIDLSA